MGFARIAVARHIGWRASFESFPNPEKQRDTLTAHMLVFVVLYSPLMPHFAHVHTRVPEIFSRQKCMGKGRRIIPAVAADLSFHLYMHKKTNKRQHT